MILRDVKDYLAKTKVVNVQQLTQRFAVSPELLRAILQKLVRAGCVKRAQNPAGCGVTCTQCETQFREIYYWVECPSA